jgi:L-fuculose-phosphate aldolase
MIAAGPSDRRPTEDAVRRGLLDAARALGGLGLQSGRRGDLSVRWHRGGADGLLVTPVDLEWARCTPDDLVWIPLADGQGPDGAPVDPRPDGSRAPATTWRLHRDLYLAREDAGAIVRALAPFGAALSCLPAVQRDGLGAFHVLVAAAGGDDIRCASPAAPGTSALSANALAALRGRRACLLAHQGVLAIGETPASACALALDVEWLAQTYAIAASLGGPASLPDDDGAHVRAGVGPD